MSKSSRNRRGGEAKSSQRGQSKQYPEEGCAEAITAQWQHGWRIQGVWVPALVSTILLVLAFPPLSIYPLAWVAPVGWLLIAARTQAVGRRGYFQLWVAGCLFWLPILHSIRLAFWVLYFGWIALALYLAIYLPLSVGVTRWLLHRWRFPLMLAAPIAWTGCEMIRSYMLTGYAANTLAHSQAWQPSLIQIADTLGHGGVSFLIIMFAAALLQAGQAVFGRNGQASDGGSSDSEAASGASSEPILSATLRAGMIRLCLAGLIPLATWQYGQWRLEQADQMLSGQVPLLRCLVLQENTPSIFEVNPQYDESVDRVRSAWNAYANLCRKTVQQEQASKPKSQFDLVIWPESTFTALEPIVDTSFPPDQVPQYLIDYLRQFHFTIEDLERDVTYRRRYFDLKVMRALLASRGLEPSDALPDEAGPDLLVGCDHIGYGPDRIRRHAGAVWIDSKGAMQDQYHKMHLVMFGEYIPLRPVLGWLENVFGFAGSDAGDVPKSFTIKGVQVAPNICFESMVPRLILWQVKQLRSQDQTPSLLVNLTNDSWFKGTSMLDHHLASSILCCVENRRPMLVAANTGLTAEIDGSGRLLQLCQRQTAQALIAQPYSDGRWALVQSAGYLLSWICAVLVCAVWLQQIVAGLGTKSRKNL